MIERETAREQNEFWSAVAHKYDAVVDLQIGPGTREMVRGRLEREDRLGILAEFGCGTGFFTEALARKAERVLATDLSPRMIEVARQRSRATNVHFQQEDCQKTSLGDAAFDTAFLSLVIHFTDPARCLVEMHRILKRGGRLIIANLDPAALTGLARIRCRSRVIFHGLTRYRTKPPKNFGDNIMSEKQICDLLTRLEFKVVSAETFRNARRASNIPIEYITAVKI